MNGSDFNRELFKAEIEVLEKAIAEIAAGKFKDNELLSSYKTMLTSYEKLLTLTQKVFRVSDIQAKILIKRESEIKNLLDNTGQCFLTFGEDLTVRGEYSAECTCIFGKKIDKKNILTLLASDNEEHNRLFAEIFTNIWHYFHQASDLNRLPAMVYLNERYLHIKYKLLRMDNDGNELLIMLILTDVTEIYKAQEQVSYLSYHDHLTSLYNRAYIDSWLTKLHPFEHFPVSIIMADMNGLKLTNDVYGHAQGDRLLVRMAQVFLRCCRKKDIIARWGGDEYVIILPGTDAKACAKVCARIKAACAEEKDLPIELSVALGMASQQNPDSSISDLFNTAEKMMYNDKLLESKQVRRRIIMDLENMLNANYFENEGHIERVKKLALDFAGHLWFRPESIEVQNLSLLASLHDIGKIAIPEEILGKPGTLSPAEWQIMQSHREIGFRMAQSIGETAVAEAILALNERWDGQGYPFKLQGEQIPVLARLFAIVHTYDVMTHDRPYRKALSREEALNELKKASGSQFDPVLTGLFLKFLK